MSKPYKIFTYSVAVVAILIIGVFIGLKIRYPDKYRDIIAREAEAFGIDETLVKSVIWTESKYKPNAESGAGAVGLMQLMPSTAEFAAKKAGEEFDADELKNPAYNIRLGVCYLRYLLDKFDEENALAAYNAGEGNVRKWMSEGLEPEEYPYKETREYIKRVRFTRKIYKWLDR